MTHLVIDERRKFEHVGITNIFASLSSPVSMAMFRHIASNGAWTSKDLMSELNPAPTKKQFYTNMAKLKQAGLVSKSTNNHRLTGMGRIAFTYMRFLDRAYGFRTQLDLIERMPIKRLNAAEIKELVDSLIKDETVRNMAYPTVVSEGEHK